METALTSEGLAVPELQAQRRRSDSGDPAQQKEPGAGSQSWGAGWSRPPSTAPSRETPLQGAHPECYWQCLPAQPVWPRGSAPSFLRVGAIKKLGQRGPSRRFIRRRPVRPKTRPSPFYPGPSWPGTLLVPGGDRAAVPAPCTRIHVFPSNLLFREPRVPEPRWGGAMGGRPGGQGREGAGGEELVLPGSSEDA